MFIFGWIVGMIGSAILAVPWLRKPEDDENRRRLELIRDLTIDGDGMNPAELVREIYDITVNGVPEEYE